MKKIVISFLSACTLFTFVSSNFVFAKANDEQKCQTCSIASDDLENVFYQDKVFNEEGELIEFKAIVPLADGRIPGCEPMYSGPCTGWYYTYSYKKIA